MNLKWFAQLRLSQQILVVKGENAMPVPSLKHANGGLLARSPSLPSSLSLGEERELEGQRRRQPAWRLQKSGTCSGVDAEVIAEQGSEGCG